MWMPSRVPDQIVPVPTLDARSLLSAQDRVQLAGKEIGQTISSNGKWNGLQQVTALGLKTTGRVRINLDLDLQSFVGMQAGEEILIGFNYEQLTMGVGLQKARLNGRLPSPLPRFELDPSQERRSKRMYPLPAPAWPHGVAVPGQMSIGERTEGSIKLAGPTWSYRRYRINPFWDQPVATQAIVQTDIGRPIDQISQQFPADRGPPKKYNPFLT